VQIVFAEQQFKHNPANFLIRGRLQANPELPQRAQYLLQAVQAAGHSVVAPQDYGTAPLAAVHTPEYLQFLATIHARWQDLPGAADEVIPNVHPDRRDGRYPGSPVGQAGYHMADTACPISADTWESVRWSANSAIHAAQLLLSDVESVYALCRPPGHHAYTDRAGGFCFINNTAVAAQILRRRYDRVAILDVDVHHGNGTQGIFYQRSDVLTVSLHADPDQFYPVFWGYADERGSAAGLGYNFNLPLALGSGDDEYLSALDLAIGRIQAFQPGALLIALGLDAFVGDPLAGLAITTEGFARIAGRIAALQLPTLLIQEGGYLCDALGANLLSFIDGFANPTGKKVNL
jgi:acetoin utilization deacetylase AcuC-like enzyme